jgi:hypothetical protein
MSFDTVDTHNNPGWLNRVLARKKEAELGVAFGTSAAGTAVLRSGGPVRGRRAGATGMKLAVHGASGLSGEDAET